MTSKLVRVAVLALFAVSLAADAKQRPKPKPHSAAGKSLGHLRLSAWVDFPIDPVYLGREKAELTDPAKRARIGKNIIDGKGIIDDLSLLSTIIINGDGGVTWHPMFIPGYAKKRVQYLKDIISIAHENGIQVLCGYAIADEGVKKGERGKAFVKLMDTATDQKLKQHAANIIKFVYEDNGLEFDGISFDLEINGLNEKHKANVTKLYHFLAKDLQARGGKLLAYATGLGVDKGNAVKEKTLGSFMAQPFAIGKGHSNILVRPMAYDVNLKEDALFAWHNNIAQYAVDHGIPPAQFQLGVKTLGNSGGNVTKPALVAKRGREILKPKGEGLIIFAMSKHTDWKKYQNYRDGLDGQ
jgi:hypothetical protein